MFCFVSDRDPGDIVKAVNVFYPQANQQPIK